MVSSKWFLKNVENFYRWGGGEIGDKEERRVNAEEG